MNALGACSFHMSYMLIRKLTHNISAGSDRILGAMDSFQSVDGTNGQRSLQFECLYFVYRCLNVPVHSCSPAGKRVFGDRRE